MTKLKDALTYVIVVGGAISAFTFYNSLSDISCENESLKSDPYVCPETALAPNPGRATPAASGRQAGSEDRSADVPPRFSGQWRHDGADAAQPAPHARPPVRT